MTPLDHLSWLRRELYAFGHCLDGRPAAPIVHCAPWTLHDLADHLGRGNLWAAAAVTRHRGDHQPPPAPTDSHELRVWFGASAVILLTVLSRDPATPAWSFGPVGTVGFWRRRRCLETLVHRWDAQNALGAPGPIDPGLAADGVAEVLDVLAPRQFALGRAEVPRQAVRLTATDTGSSWVYGPGKPVASVTATAPDLLLMLWRRRSVLDPAMSYEGDISAIQSMAATSLVP